MEEKLDTIAIISAIGQSDVEALEFILDSTPPEEVLPLLIRTITLMEGIIKMLLVSGDTAAIPSYEVLIQNVAQGLIIFDEGTSEGQ